MACEAMQDRLSKSISISLSMFFLGGAISATRALTFLPEALGEKYSTPLLGFGNELVFQNTNDTGLNNLIKGSHSQIQRYPGGTPSGFWNWRSGWEDYRNEADLKRPCTASTWSSYLGYTNQTTILVPNILGSNLTNELEGLEAMRTAGVDVRYIELGNEMYDDSIPEIVSKYNASAANYSTAMLEWVTALKKAYPKAKIALVGQTAAWNTIVLSSSAGQVVDALTYHAYTRLPDGPYNTNKEFQSVVAQGMLQALQMESNFASSIPSGREVWITEYGAYGGVAAQDTWIKALFMASQSMHMSNLPGVTMLLPYCLVCHDFFAPSFNTSNGPVTPGPNGTYTPGPWSRSPTGVALAALFNFTAAHTTVQEVAVICPEQLQSNASWCSLQEAGIVGTPIAPALNTSSQQACMDYCARTQGCSFWQLVTGTSKCYLKGPEANYSANGGSVAGPAHCQHVAGVTGWMGEGDFLFLNGSPHAITCLDLSSLVIGLSSDVNLYVDVLKVMAADLGRHGVQESEIIQPTITQPAACVELNPWSLTRLSWDISSK